MRRHISIAIVLVALAAGPAAAGELPTCCACLLQHSAMTSQVGPAMPALFCEAVGPGAFPAFEDQCDAAGGNGSLCVKPAPGQRCPAALADQGIGCPAGVGAPAASASTLAGMVLLLLAVGGFAARRRSS